MFRKQIQWCESIIIFDVNNVFNKLEILCFFTDHCAEVFVTTLGSSMKHDSSLSIFLGQDVVSNLIKLIATFVA